MEGAGGAASRTAGRVVEGARYLRELRLLLLYAHRQFLPVLLVGRPIELATLELVIEDLLRFRAEILFVLDPARHEPEDEQDQEILAEGTVGRGCIDEVQERLHEAGDLVIDLDIADLLKKREHAQRPSTSAAQTRSGRKTRSRPRSSSNHKGFPFLSR